jgi:hypothetical protein
MDVRIFQTPYASVVATEFSRLVEHSLVRKQDAWKESGSHIDRMQHDKSEDLSLWLVSLLFLDNLHFLCKQMQPLMEYSVQCLTWYIQFSRCLTGGFTGLLWNALRIS